MKKLLFILTIALNMTCAIAQTSTYKGTIGKYKIVMELNTEDGTSYTGRYRYDGKTQWIALSTGGSYATKYHRTL